MMWIGLTGGIGTGKSTAAEILRKAGYVVLDADEVSKQVVRHGTPGLKSIVQTFGQEYLLPDQSLNRKKIAMLVFDNPVMLTKLENILHPLIKKEIEHEKEKLIQNKTNIAFYDVPLLFEKNMENQFDAIILISCQENLQIQRLKSRSQLSDLEIKARLKNQMSLSEKKKKTTFIVENDSTFANLENELLACIQKIIQKA